MVRPLAVAELGSIASIWAHPDDETYLAGGIMAAAVATGQPVVCVSATAGEHGTDDPGTWPPERLGRVRRWEAAAAMAVLGVGDHRWLNLPDGRLAALAPEEPVRRFTDLFDEFRPDTVLTFGPDGDTFHPDHRTVSAWVRAACRRAGHGVRLLHAARTDSHLATWGALYEQLGIYMTEQRPTGVPAGQLAVHWRAQIVLLSAQGMDVPQIAQVTFSSEDRVRDVLHNFNRDGFDSLYPRYAGGRPPTVWELRLGAARTAVASATGPPGVCVRGSQLHTSPGGPQLASRCPLLASPPEGCPATVRTPPGRCRLPSYD